MAKHKDRKTSHTFSFATKGLDCRQLFKNSRGQNFNLSLKVRVKGTKEQRAWESGLGERRKRRIGLYEGR